MDSASNLSLRPSLNVTSPSTKTISKLHSLNQILDLCLIKGSKDNMTAAVIKFPKQTIGSGGGVTARRERRGANDSEDGEQNVKYVGLRRSPTPNPYVPRNASGDDDTDGKPL